VEAEATVAFRWQELHQGLVQRPEFSDDQGLPVSARWRKCGCRPSAASTSAGPAFTTAMSC